jgi:dynein intermediate chain
LVDGAGSLEVWDVTLETEVPMTKDTPTPRKGAGLLSKSLNRVAWEGNEGKRIAVGGLDGVVTIFEVGSELGGLEGARAEEWSAVKRLVGRLEANDGAVVDNGA